MRTFSIEGGIDSPRVYMNEAESLVEISGISTLTETNWFYSNLLKWLIAFNKGHSHTATINIKLQRMNDSSSRWLRLIFRKLMLLAPGTGIEINMYLNGKSPSVLACGQLLQNETTFRVNLLSQTAE